MKIPVYQKNVPYRGSYAREVALARPLKKSVERPFWQALKQTGLALQAGVKGYEKAEKLMHGALPDQAEQEGIFSSQNRTELLKFCQENLLTSPQTDGPSTAERLDQYVASNSMQFQSNPLLTQDFAVLRRGAMEAEKEYQKLYKREQLNQGAQAFLKTACAVRGAAALEEYLQSNLSAMSAEMRPLGLTKEKRKEYQTRLRRQAIVQNISSAVQAGQTEEAEQTCRRFSGELPTEVHQVLVQEIAQKKAEMHMQTLPEDLHRALQNPDGTFSAEKAQEMLNGVPVSADEKEIFKQVFIAQTAEKIRQEFGQEAQAYKKALTSAPDEKNSELLFGWSAHRWALLQKARQTLPLANRRQNPSVFNRLYENAVLGKTQRAEIEKSFEEEKINAQEYLLLAYQFCQRQAGETDPCETLLLQGIDGLCREHKASSEQKNALKYMIYTSSTEVQTRLAAARRAEQILRLEEEKK